MKKNTRLRVWNFLFLSMLSGFCGAAHGMMNGGRALSNLKLTVKIAESLAHIDAYRDIVEALPMTAFMLEKLRETARLASTHYSTRIEGNRLTMEQVEEVLFKEKTIPGRTRDEAEVKGYYAALDAVEALVARGASITERVIQMLHAFVMAGGRMKVSPSPYRDGQNVIREGATGNIVYMPPEAKDVPSLMKELVAWIRTSDLPCPLIAGIAHYQFATIHPYYDGNGRVARLLATLILRLGGYDLKGIYSLDEYYARDLSKYYQELSVGPSHNYYIGRAEADITAWSEYFCSGVAVSFRTFVKHAADESASDKPDQSKILRKLDNKQRRALELFRNYETVTARQIGELFGFHSRTSSKLCQKWVEDGFIIIVDPSKKGRKYQLASQYLMLLE